MNHRYASLADIRDRGVGAGAADDAAVDTALARATRMIEIYAARDFLSREETYLVDGTGTDSLFLEDRPVVQVLTLGVDGYAIPPESFALYPDAGYIRLKGARRDIFAGFPGWFPKGAQNVSVHGFFGFTEVPPEVNEACILLALEVLRAAANESDIGTATGTRHAIGIKRVRVDDISVDFEYPGNIKAGTGQRKTTGLPTADALLRPFRDWLHPVAV